MFVPQKEKGKAEKEECVVNEEEWEQDGMAETESDNFLADYTFPLLFVSIAFIASQILFIHTMDDKNYCGYYKTNSYIHKIRSKSKEDRKKRNLLKMKLHAMAMRYTIKCIDISPVLWTVFKTIEGKKRKESSRKAIR